MDNTHIRLFGDRPKTPNGIILCLIDLDLMSNWLLRFRYYLRIIFHPLKVKVMF